MAILKNGLSTTVYIEQMLKFQNDFGEVNFGWTFFKFVTIFPQLRTQYIKEISNVNDHFKKQQYSALNFLYAIWNSN